MKKPSLSQDQYEDLVDYFNYEVFPHIKNCCIPDMTDVKVRGDQFSDIFKERQSFLVLQALSVLEKEIKKL
jgi:hypothetical protein